MTESTLGGAARPAIVGPVPGRLTWTLPIPRHAELRLQLAVSGAPVRLRVGVSDARIYEELVNTAIAPGASWTPVAADLSAYAGRKFSLFYRPERQSWRVNLSLDAVAGPAVVALAAPSIVAAREDALEYAPRRARLTRSGAP